MTLRDLEPSKLVHSLECPVVQGKRIPLLTTPEIARQYPNAKMHLCYHFTLGLVETVRYEPHNYRPSTVKYPDATKACCRECGGTHGLLDTALLPVVPWPR